MEKSSVQKLQAAGYILIRKQDYEAKYGKMKYAIKQSKDFGFWTHAHVFDTKAARDRKIAELLKDDKIIME